uniref:G-protein coupled receptors family 1 profile domain-containing protein n=1 Tax=Naja naja TaxID=35670 RepID=A0A8C7E3U5_NAJNA
MEGYEGNWEDWMFSGVSVNDSEFQNGTTDYLGTLTELLVFILSLLGNSLVILVVILLSDNSVTDVYLLSLAIADFLFAVTLPIWAVYRAHEWIFGTCMCKIASALKEVNFYSGVLLLAFISFDRHLAIVYATRAATQKKHWVKFVCTGIWLLAFRFSLPVIHFWEAFKLSNFSNRVCYVNIVLRILPQVFGFLLPLTIMIILLVFVICWLPYNIALLSDTLLRLQYFTETCSVRERIDEALSSSEILGVAHSCINPIIYAFIGQKFRNNCLKILVSRGIISKEMLMRYRKGSTYSSPSGNTSITL